jgi:hypothetical protein
MGLFDTFRSALRSPSRAAAERDYLNQSVSRADLGRRMAEIDRGLFRHLPGGR